MTNLENRYRIYIRCAKNLVLRLLVALLACILGGEFALLFCLVIFGLAFQAEIAWAILPTQTRWKGFVWVSVLVFGWLCLKVLVNESTVYACLQYRLDSSFRILHYLIHFIGTSILFYELFAISKLHKVVGSSGV